MSSESTTDPRPAPGVPPTPAARPTPGRPPTRRPLTRGRSHWRDWPLLGWFLTATVVTLVHRSVPDASWLLLHLVLLGALTHSIMVWSMHFAETLLRTPKQPHQDRRLALLTVGSAAVLIGVPTAWWPLTLVGGTLVAAAVIWHGAVLVRMLGRALPARFRMTVRYYLAAAGSLVVGVGLGITLAWGWDDTWHGRLLVAHALANLLGWVGLTVAGTLLTLWPAMLRTRMDETAERRAIGALPVFATGLVTVVAGALLGVSWLAAAGLVVYLAAFALWARGLWLPLRTKPPAEFAPASVGCALVWLLLGLGWAGWILVSAVSWEDVRLRFIGPAAMLGAGFAVQLLTGALSYLLPSVLGGGPSVVRAGQRWFEAGAGFRLIAINGGLVLWLAPTPSWVKVTGSLLALGAAAAFLPVMVGGIRAAVRARKALVTGAGPAQTTAPAAERSPLLPRKLFTSGQVIAGLTALLVAIVVGVGVDPPAARAWAANLRTSSGTGSTTGDGDSGVVPTGRVVQVQVEMRDMHYVPDQVTVNRGDRLVVELVNVDGTTHDLVIGTARSPRIKPGDRAELDAGVIATSTRGFCSVVGHHQRGMLFDVKVAGTSAGSSSSAESPAAAAPVPGAPAADAPVPAVLDPVLPSLATTTTTQHTPTTHRLTLSAQEVPLEVAPGVWQRRWTFNGRAPGPVLHGRVGDIFEITLINDGTFGHSIDFHAGALSPDSPMRTIEPGESLVYRFTAVRAGIWMYHCSTMPMSAHIAAGMFGAVVIEPENLPAVDRSYVLVQSETYLSGNAATAQQATEVNANAAAANEPSYLAFNGVAFGYDDKPLTVRAGERVRFWVLDAGPNRASSFHVVGAQFDTVYREGAYLLKRGRDAYGSRDGGAQVLALQPAEGGFVETVFTQPGHYSMVSHAMADAERGVHGVVAVR